MLFLLYCVALLADHDYQASQAIEMIGKNAADIQANAAKITAVRRELHKK